MRASCKKNTEIFLPYIDIFICSFDPFGQGLYRYTFEERCLEREISLGDGTRKIFLNTKGKNEDEVPEELVHFLKYMEESTSEYVSSITDESIIHLHEKITELKKQRKLEARYMTVEEWMNIRADKAKTEGKAEDILLLLSELGNIPSDLETRILTERDSETLKNWLKLAARAESVEQFQREISQQ